MIKAIKGVAENLIFSLGEEIGWRGLFVPELTEITNFTKTALISGIVWAAWHMPGIFLIDLNGVGTPTVYSAAMFAVMVIGISFPFAWLTLKSGSLWPAVLLQSFAEAVTAAVHIERNPQHGQIVREIVEVSPIVERSADRPSFSPLFRYEAGRGLLSTGNHPMRTGLRASDLGLPEFIFKV